MLGVPDWVGDAHARVWAPVDPGVPRIPAPRPNPESGRADITNLLARIQEGPTNNQTNQLQNVRVALRKCTEGASNALHGTFT